MTELLYELDKLCDTILAINKNIQSAVIINKNGRAVEKKIRDSTVSQMPDHKNEMLLMQCALTISMGRDFDEDYGPVGYAVIDRESTSMFSFPVGELIILVTSKKDISPISLAKKITNTIQEYKTKTLVESVSV
jgi:hypothetical protein